MQELAKPELIWGPANDEDRAEFLQRILDKSGNHNRAEVDPGQPSESIDAEVGSDPHLQTDVDQLLNSVMKKTNFFQSKLSVAEKMAKGHLHELRRQGIVRETIDMSSIILGFVVSYPSIFLIRNIFRIRQIKNRL